MSTFFTSDTHFGHANIIKYCNRPFSSVEEMDEQLITNWNSKVTPNDIIYHLGDFAFYPPEKITDLLDRLNGTKVFIPGNHDKNLVKAITNTPKLDRFLDNPLLEVTLTSDDEKIKFVLCHYAMRVWNGSHWGSIHLYGHSHGSLQEDIESRSMDVGVDTNNYTPYSLEDILAYMYKRSAHKVDHHDNKTS